MIFRGVQCSWIKEVAISVSGELHVFRVGCVSEPGISTIRMVRFAVQTAEVAVSHATKRCRTEGTETSCSALASVDSDDRPFAALFDPDTLDCGVCMEPLSPPIFQVFRRQTILLVPAFSDLKCVIG